MSRTKARARKAGHTVPKRKRDDTDDLGDRASKKPAIERPEQTTCDDSIAMMDAAILSDHLAKFLKQHSSQSTDLELEDKYVATKSIRDTTTFSEPRLAKHLPAFLETFSYGGKAKLLLCDGVASPHTLVVAASGMRVADLTRELRCLATEDSKVAKLFAKHMKLKDNIAFVQRTRIGIGVGTPNRLRELLEQDAVSVEPLKRIVIDGSYIDDKKRSIFDMKEVYLPLVDLLNLEGVKSRLGSGDGAIELMVF